MTFRWNHDPQYSHGYLVPAFALALLWIRRDRLPELPLQPSLWGLALVLAGITMRLTGTYYFFAWFDAASLLVCLAGLCLAAGGLPAWRWAWPSVAFLTFMVPLPHRLAVAMTDPLQRIATLTSTFFLQTVGMPAVADGNVIHLNEVELGVVEACSGLRMLMIFIALSAGVVLVIQRPLWEKLVLLASATPIAIITNVVRITATGILHETAGRAIADAVFHDLAGWLMMPFALGLMWIELQLLNRLFVAADTAQPRVDLRLPQTAAPAAPRRQKWVKTPAVPADLGAPVEAR
jgi:exosortase